MEGFGGEGRRERGERGRKKGVYESVKRRGLVGEERVWRGEGVRE